MKSIFYSFIFLIVACVVLNACKNNSSNEDELKDKLSTSLVSNPRTMDDTSSHNHQKIGSLFFSDTLHDFGRITEGEIVLYDFSFTNNGNQDVIINEAKASCGCTVPEYPKTPIKPGEQSTIKITFNSQGKKGYNEKTVMVITNGNPSILNLTILAEVN